MMTHYTNIAVGDNIINKTNFHRYIQHIKLYKHNDLALSV